MTNSQSVSTRLKMGIVALLYFAEGAPYAFINTAMPVFFREMGKSLDKIGILGLIGLPWTLKPLWAPLIDKFGKRWQWITAMQIAMALLVIAVAFSADPSTGFLVWLVILSICVASATQDISIDAYTIEMLEEHELGKANGVRVAAYRVAIIAAGGGVIALSQYFGWRTVLLALAVTLSLFALRTAVIGKAYLFFAKQKSQTFLGSYVQPVRRLLTIRRFALVAIFILMFKVGDAMMTFMVGPFWIDHGFSKAEYGTVSATVGVVLSIVGSLIGGWITSRIGIFRGLILLGAFQAISNLGYAYAALNTSKITV